MYERTAVVLEKYFNNVLGLEEKINLKTNYKNFKELIEEFQNYQEISEKEEKVINEFDNVANQIRNIQQEQKRLYKSNLKQEEDRSQLFDNLDETPNVIEKKLEKIENTVKENNTRLVELKLEFIRSLEKFNNKYAERNRISKEKRTKEEKYMKLIEKVTSEFNETDKENVKHLKMFGSIENTTPNELVEIMLENGKDAKIKFDENVMKKSAEERNNIAKKEAECYVLAYEKTKKLLNDINSDIVNIEKYQKILKDISVKFAFLKAEKMYIVDFLDNERMTAINGEKTHKGLMAEACTNFDADITQIENLYQLVIKEITGKSTKKAYNELYNKEYLKNIEEKEKNFEKETNGIRIKAGTIINSNYWRIEGIKNIYDVFNKEISEKYEKDLSDYQLEEIDDDADDDIDYDNIKVIEENQNNTQFDENDIDDDYEDDDYEGYDDFDDEEDDEFEDEDVEDDNNFDEEDDDMEDDDDFYYDDEELDDEEYEDDEYDDDFEYEDDDDDDDYDDDEDEYEDDEEDEETNKKQKVKKESTENVKSKGLFNKFFKEKNKKEK